MKVSSIGHLEALAQVNQDIMNILMDFNISRRAAALKIYEDHGIFLSDKLVRTYRNKLKEGYSTLRDLMEEKTNAVDTTEIPVKQGKAASGKTIVVMPDVQAPLHDVALVNKFIDFIGDFQPTELAQVGDFTDSTEISRWVRGKKPEFAGDLKQGFISARNILKSIRENFDGRFRIVRSNHDDRLELYIESCAPGLASFLDDELSIETLVHFNKYDVEFVRDEVVELAPGWVMAHGDEGSLSPVAGKTAFGLAKNKFGVSTVCGHTHRAGMTSESTGYNGQIRNTLTGLEVGHFMDLTKADYLKKKGVAANWQQAFGIIEVIHGKVFPRLITVQDGEFFVDGKLY